MWSDLEKGFQLAFAEGWEAYKNDTIPIGVAILDTEGNLMSTGQNQIFTAGSGLIQHHQLAHAEINAILKLSEINHPTIRENIRTYTLYSTMEPCPLCFGAIIMGSIRHLKYAARDTYAGATAINDTLPYAQRKKITVTGPFPEAEMVQIALQFEFELRRGRPHAVAVFRETWGDICPKGIEIGQHLHDHHTLPNMADSEIQTVYDHIINLAKG